MTYIVLFTNEHGRESYQLTDDPIRTLALRVAEGKMTAKQAKAATVLETKPASLHGPALDAAIAFHRAVEQARVNPQPLRESIMEKKVDEAFVARVRTELQAQTPWIEADFAHPWPFSSDESA